MHVPVATYRLQFTHAFNFKAGARVVPYLARLGISDLFASPVSRARPGSMHGYDVIDHNDINPELGGMDGLRGLRRAVESHDMAWLQDIVPNHMAFDKHNARLADVLERGRSSAHSDYFDIDWAHQYESLRGRVLAPFLGSFYAEALENGEIRLEYGREGLGVHYYDQRYPIALHTYRRVLAHGIERLEQRLGPGNGELVRFLGALHFLETIVKPDSEQLIPVEEIEHAKLMVWDSCERNEQIAAFVQENVALFNGKDGRWDLLDDLLSQQWYRLSFWKVASDEINYRRFFTVNDLICIHVSRPNVFDESHRLIARLVDDGVFQGLRVDHIDGISDPQAYLDRLRRLAPDGYLVVEKVLGSHETLPNAWPVQGTTGYDFLDKVNSVFVRRANEREMTRTYARFIGENTTFDSVLRARKRLMVGKHFAGNIENLAYRLKRIAGEERYGRDITMYALKRAMVEVMVHFPVYRTYVSERGFSDADRQTLHQAVSAARRAFPEMTYELYFIEQYLFHPMLDEDTGDERKEELVAFVNEFQQLTGPLMAKGCEDTAFYVYNRLISLNEVGGDPGEFGIELDEFHRFCGERARLWPHAMNTTATHDTKRGEDTRLRIDVLSEIPREWDRKVRHWAKLNRKKKTVRDGERMPDANDEYLLYQTLIGTLPHGRGDMELLEKRICAYMVKAVREAKVHTAWIKPDSEYEEATVTFVKALLDTSGDNAFLRDLYSFVHDIAHFGLLSSLSQVILKMTCPGVPDLYQGGELWDLSLVDPDNRRDVDFAVRDRMLHEIEGWPPEKRGETLRTVLSAPRDGKVKLALIHLLLKARSRHEQLFRDGDYVPLKTRGCCAGNLVAFARTQNGTWSVTLAPRFYAELVRPGELPLGTKVWEDTVCLLPENAPGQWRDEVTGSTLSSDGTLRVGRVLTDFPVALLVSA